LPFGWSECPGLQVQVPPGLQCPTVEEIMGSELQVWFMPGTHERLMVRSFIRREMGQSGIESARTEKN
jgi:hypothetical protein